MTNSVEFARAHSNTDPLFRAQAGEHHPPGGADKSSHRTEGACGGSAPATSTTGTGEPAAAVSSIRRLVGPMRVELTLPRT